MARKLADKLEALAELVEVTEARVPSGLTQQAGDVVARAGERLKLGQQTVVALAGATGSGKSSLFNALAGQDLAEVGARRPTTSHTFAVSFGPSDPELLDWLGITRRNEVDSTAKGTENLVLLDLPDHDSTQVEHHAEVDRMVRVVDQFCFVVDPQKYADAALHQRYLRPLAGHRDVITVVLNHSDRLSPEELRACLADLRRLLDDDGLAGVPIIATSAATGRGVDELRSHLGKVATKKSATTTRLIADIAGLAGEFDAAIGQAAGTKLPRITINQLQASLEVAAGVPVVTDAVRTSMVHRGVLATGWPLVKWLRKFRPDPLKRLRLGGGRKEDTAAITEHSSLPARGSVSDSQLRTALRTISDEASKGMPRLWRESVHVAVHERADSLPDALDRAVVSADLGTERKRIWWQLLRGLQWLLIVAVGVGALWLGANMVLAYFMLPALPGYPVTFSNGFEIPTPTLLVVGGLVSGVVLGALSRVFVGLGARGAARRARSVLSGRVREVAQSEVLLPLTQELERQARSRELLHTLR